MFKYLLVLFFFNSIAHAETEALLKEVSFNVDKVESDLIILKNKQVIATDNLAKNVFQTSEITNNLKKLNSQVEENEKQKNIISTQVTEVNLRLDVSRTTAERRLRALYKSFHRAVIFELILNSKDPLDLNRRYKYLSYINNFDFKNLNATKELAFELIRKKQDLTLINNALDFRRNELIEKNDLLKLSQKLYQDLIDEQKEVINSKQERLTVLNQSKEKLENILNGVMGGSTQINNPFVSDKPFQSLIGKYNRPVKGELIYNFGTHHLSDIDDDIFVKGEEFKTKIGEKILLIADGVVILQQQLPGLGMVIIVDHGDRYYTLYGRLASTLVSKGSKLRAGSTIGISGEIDARGRNFYFEFRNKGRAENPKILFN